ncbi:Asp-tRNA(Asn)/Glu-tRNA(Gln) amidotransferase subunit GatA [Candidatus Woesearchaeota archaeon]|nr:Asp-tRNA(Asn)/Glu-tRNA(Gln) amidotransferase subunit GatA [Candidatus Woesearchaeota archaeon]
MKMRIDEYIEKVQNGKVDMVLKTKKVLAEIKKINKEYHYFNVICEDLALEQAKTLKKNAKSKRLAGLFISVKDCINVKDVESTAGSRILKGYKPLFNATAVQRVIDEGAIIIGKTSQDEFGFGSFATNVGLGYKTPLNPVDKKRVCGGSSGGSGGISKLASFEHVSLGESTGGSIVAPASFCGVIGFCPTYGRVSRYGLIDYGNSLDKIGAMGTNPEAVALVQEVISGHDQKDSTSLEVPTVDYAEYLEKSIKGFKIGVIEESMGKGVDVQVMEALNQTIKKLEFIGAKVKKISLKQITDYAVPTYYILATTEASTNLAKYCGMRYGAHEKLEGSFNDYFSTVRSKHLGEEAKRRIMLGSFARMAGYRDAYYIKAQQSRQLMVKEYQKAFKDYDLLLCPTMPVIPPTFNEAKKLTPLQNYMMDVMTAGPNLAGLPHASIPLIEHKGLPIGMMFIADQLKEEKLFQLIGALQQDEVQN